MFAYSRAMSRARTIPDEAIHARLRVLLAEGGEKAVSFASVAHATGLAASTLAQRFGTRDGMVQVALLDGWDRLTAQTAAAETEAPLAAKGVAVLLKLIGNDQEAEIAVLAANMRDADLRARAEAWRTQVETALATRLSGNPAKKHDSAAMIFALWQGRLLWTRAGEPAFRMKDAIKRLG